MLGDPGDVASLSSFPGHDTTGGNVTPYGPPGTTGAARPSYATPPPVPNAYGGNAYRNSYADGADTDSVFSALNPPATRTPGTDGTDTSPAVNRPSTVGSDVPESHRSVRTGAAQPPAFDETPFSSPAPSGIQTGTSSDPGSPDSLDMIMDWEEAQDAQESTEERYDRLLTDVLGPAIPTSPSTPRSTTPCPTSTSSGSPSPRCATARSTWTP
ncbi:hypothetical protein SHKM778_18720 [Streptomyces sp. KM77-8]|uniref:Uncharacterized protein n=1 Tax=Streptomyces haneummycinicus TaxID=3074435 RepID=A0AAT9HDG1_9ACTN